MIETASPAGTTDPVEAPPAEAVPDLTAPPATIPIADVRYRTVCRVRGRVRSLRVRPWADSPTLELVLVDGTGGITVVFLARRAISGIAPGTVMTVEGMVGSNERRLAMLNPVYELEAEPSH